jgi:hypothetical protein
MGSDYATSDELVARVAELEAENVDLRERIAHLEERAATPLGTLVGRKPAKSTNPTK